MPDEEMAEYAELKNVDFNEMVLIYENGDHFNLVVAKDSDLATKGSLSFRTNIGPFMEDKNIKTNSNNDSSAAENELLQKEIRSLKDELKKSSEKFEFIKEDYQKCDKELKNKTEEVEMLKIELNSLRELKILEESASAKNVKCEECQSIVIA